LDITWLGHASIRVRTRLATVVMDPADKSAGFDMGRPTANIVTVSHQHPFHANVAGVRGKPIVIEGPGEYEIQGVQLYGLSAELPASGNGAPQRNTAFVLEAEGLHLAHLGGMAIAPGEEAELFSNLDILVLPLSTENGPDPERAARTVRALEPAITIPVAYTPGDEQGPLKRFLDSVGISAEAPVERLSLQRRGGETQRIVLLEPSRQQ